LFAALLSTLVDRIVRRSFGSGKTIPTWIDVWIILSSGLHQIEIFVLDLDLRKKFRERSARLMFGVPFGSGKPKVGGKDGIQQFRSDW
jgi:hypothetical protein